MKNNAIRMFLALGAACLYGSALDAQTNHLLSAKVPFDFQASGQTFAAGKYVLRGHGSFGIPSIQSAASGHTSFIAGAGRTLTQEGPPRLVFHCYTGNGCFLSEIRPANGEGMSLSMSRVEKEIANGERPVEMTSVSVALRTAD